MAILQTRKGNPQKPPRVMAYGVEGVGKSTLGARAEKPIFLTPEGGIDQLRTATGELVDVSGVSKGKGFAGGVKRWHYRGGDASHGSMHHRAPGGIGGSSFPSRVWKNQHFPGHMGNAKVTAKNLKVIKVDNDENLLLVRGSVPGPSGTYIFIRKARKAK